MHIFTCVFYILVNVIYVYAVCLTASKVKAKFKIFFKYVPEKFVHTYIICCYNLDHLYYFIFSSTLQCERCHVVELSSSTDLSTPINAHPPIAADLPPLNSLLKVLYEVLLIIRRCVCMIYVSVSSESFVD